MITSSDIDWMRGFVARNRWTYAKTMPEHPHEYAVRKQVANDADFDRFVTLIRENGYRRPFYKKGYVSFDLDSWFYWTMGAPLYNADGTECTIIINRAQVTDAYHTALGKQVLLTNYETDLFEIDRSVALVHDLMSGPLPSYYAAADVFYAEPPWRHGWEVFLERSGGIGASFNAFMEEVSATIAAWPGIPKYIIAGKDGAKHLPPSDQTLPVDLNGAEAVALFYGEGPVSVPAGCGTRVLIEALAARHRVVGDFCCGYGRTGRIFKQHGGDFVMSDVNRTCIGYIAHNARGWADVPLPAQQRMIH